MSDDYRKGLLWTSLGVLCLTPDSLLVRFIDTDPWTLLFWRGLLMSLSLSAYLLVRRAPLSQMNGKGWLAATFLALSSACFVFSLQSTHAANTLVIIATSPLIAAVISWLFLRESIPLATWAAILIATSGVALSLGDGLQRGNLTGELFALGSALAMACHFTALRWWRSEHATLAICGAGFLMAGVSLLWAKPTSVPAPDIGWVLLLGAVVLPLAFAMMAVGPRYLPAPEVGLILLGETVLGPAWVWLFLRETPGPSTLAGGAIVVLTLTAHSLYRKKQSAKD